MSRAVKIIKNTFYGRMLYRILIRQEYGAEFLEVGKSLINDITLPHVWAYNIFESYEEEYGLSTTNLYKQYINIIFPQYKKDISNIMANNIRYKNKLQSFLNSNDKEFKEALKTCHLGSFLIRKDIDLWVMENDITNKCFEHILNKKNCDIRI